MSATSNKSEVAPPRGPSLGPAEIPGRWEPGVESFKASDFLARNPVFRLEEFVAAHTAAGKRPQTSVSLLRYHVRTGRLWRLRRGLYASTGGIEPWVLGSRLTRDAVLAYDGALSLYGLAPLGHSISFLTQERVRPFRFNEVVYRPVLTGRALESGEDGLQVLERAGQKLLATTLERTFVDLLDRLDLAPGLVELWRCFAAAGQLDTTAMIRQVRALESRLVAARVGLFLEERRSATPSELHLLRSMGPRSSSYFDRNLRSPEDVYFGQWKLVVPAKLLSAMRYSRAG